MKTHLISALVILASAVPCRAADVDDVRAAFGNYRTSIIIQDGARASGLVSGRTIAEYQKFVDWARDADRKALGAIPTGSRLQVVMMRHRIPADVLVKLDGAGAFKYAVDHDWIGKEGLARTVLDTIQVSGSRASAAVKIGGKPAETRLQFVKENGQWRFDLLAVLEEMTDFLQATSKQEGVTEDQLIVTFVEALSGKKVPETVWDPVK